MNSNSYLGLNTLTHYQRIKVRIPREYQNDPILSDVINRFSLKVNIFAAQLSGIGCDDGWFDLGLSGGQFQIDQALVYLNDHNVEIWEAHDPQLGDW